MYTCTVFVIVLCRRAYVLSANSPLQIKIVWEAYQLHLAGHCLSKDLCEFMNDVYKGESDWRGSTIVSSIQALEQKIGF